MHGQPLIVAASGFFIITLDAVIVNVVGLSGLALTVATFGSLLARAPSFLEGFALAAGLALATAIVSLGIEPTDS